MKKYRLCLGQSIGYKHPHPERTAQMQDKLFSDITFQVWPNRQAMARSIRMQQKRESRPSDWIPLVKLSEGEGY